MRYWPLVCIIFLLCLTACSKPAQDRWRISDFGTTDPDKLLGYAMTTEQDEVARRICSYLAAKFPEAPVGLTARAFLEWYDSDRGAEARAKRKASLQRCVDSNPKYTPCVYLLATFGAQLKGGQEESAQLLQRTLDLDPNYRSRATFLELHQKLLYDIKDPSRAQALVEKYKATFPDSYVWDYEKADAACREAKYDVCLAFFNAAKTKSDAPFLVWRQIAEMRTDITRLYDPGRDPPSIQIARSVIDDALDNRSLPPFDKREAIEWFIRQYAFSDRVADTDLYALGYSAAESHHATNAYWYMQLILYDYRTDRAMDKAVKAIPKDLARELPSEQLVLGVAHLHVDGFTEQARQLIWNGIVGQYTDQSRQSAFNNIMRIMIEMGLNREAEKLLLDFRDEFPATHAEIIEDFNVYIENQDVKEAGRALAKYPDPNQYYRADYERLMRMSQALQSRQKFLKDHALLVNWYQTFADHSEIEVRFAPGSAELPPSASADLDKLAKLMNSPDAAAYLFEVSGHLDSREDPAATPELSELRAHNVREALLQRGVPAERLVAKGYGAEAPRASGQTDAGRQANRRVEVRPIDNAASPRIAEKLPLPDSDVMLPLSGGRWAIMGNPAYRVDLINGTRVTRFREGKPVALLHHERYLLTQFHGSLADGNTRSGLALYDVLTGEMIARRELLSCDPCSQIAVNPSQDEIAYAAGVSLVVLDGETLEIKRQGIVGHESARLSQGIVWSDDGKIVISFANYDRMYVVDAASLKIERELTGIAWVHSLALSSTGRYLAAADKGGRVHVWDTKTWVEHGAVNSGSTYPTVLTTRNGSDEIAVGGEAAIAKRIDLASLDVLETWPNGETLPNDLGMRGLAYSKDGGIAYRREKSGWVAEDLQTGRSKGMATQSEHDRIVSIVGFASSNRLLVRSRFQGNDRYEVFDVKDFSRVYDLTPYLAHGEYYAYPDGNIQVLDYATGKWLRFDVNSLSFREPLDFDNPAVLAKLKSPPKETVFAGLLAPATLITFEHGNKAGSPETTLHGATYNRNGEPQHTFDLNLVTEALKYGAYETGFLYALSASGRYLAIVPAWRDGQHSWVYSTRIYAGDVQTGKFVPLQRSARPLDIEFSGELLKMKYGFGQDIFDFANAGKESHADYGDESTVDLTGGARLIVRDGGNLWLQQPPRLDNFKDASDQVTNMVEYFPDLNAVVDVAQGLLEVRDAKSLEVKFKFRLRAPGEWIAYTEDGHFVSSPNGTDGLFWNVGENYLPFEALRERFENANLLRQPEGSAVPSGTSETPDATRVAAALPTSLAVESDVFSPPYAVRIAGAAERSTTQAVETIAITVSKTYPTTLPYRLQVTLNGRILDMQTAARGLSRIDAGCDAAAAADCVSQPSFQADLQEGRNVVAVCLNFRNVCVDPQSVTILRVNDVAAGSQDPANKPRLYFFGVGISDYADSSLSLQYPRADVRGIAAAFKAQENHMFSQVPVMVLEDSHATAQAVRVAMHDFLRDATEQDIVVVYFAGHGAMEDQQLYFITYDAKRDDPYSGLDVGAVKDLLSKRPPGQKAIVILDICHAGAANAIPTRGIRAGSDEAIRLLATGTGVAVLMASTGLELSQESAQFGGGHGAFSWALIEGLNGAAARGGYVTVTGLEQYVERRVQDITGNNQHPTTSTDKFHDYPVALVQ
jgi:outer membrane protein OmpA-like peptidoglycan-associated protein